MRERRKERKCMCISVFVCERERKRELAIMCTSVYVCERDRRQNMHEYSCECERERSCRREREEGNSICLCVREVRCQNVCDISSNSLPAPQARATRHDHRGVAAP